MDVFIKVNHTKLICSSRSVGNDKHDKIPNIKYNYIHNDIDDIYIKVLAQVSVVAR